MQSAASNFHVNFDSCTTSSYLVYFGMTATSQTPFVLNFSLCTISANVTLQGDVIPFKVVTHQQPSNGAEQQEAYGDKNTAT